MCAFRRASYFFFAFLAFFATGFFGSFSQMPKAAPVGSRNTPRTRAGTSWRAPAGADPDLEDGVPLYRPVPCNHFSTSVTKAVKSSRRCTPWATTARSTSA